MPLAPPSAYKTFTILSPVETHWEDATCADVECAGHVHGWQTYTDETTELGERQAHYIRRMSGRSFSEERNEHGVTVFTFGAGQECFDVHKARTDRPQSFLVRPGDQRRYGTPYVYKRPDQWVDDFASNQVQLSNQQKKG